MKRPIWMKLQFQDTEEERKYLAEIAKRYNHTQNTEEGLSAHGVQACSNLCQILIDGELKHIKNIQNYGRLGEHGKNITQGGYWDNGWGLCVAKSKTLETHTIQSEDKEFFTIPIDDLEAVLLPTPVVCVIKSEFPKYEQLLKGYAQFADELIETS